jgi:hypothetical protein
MVYPDASELDPVEVEPDRLNDLVHHLVHLDPFELVARRFAHLRRLKYLEASDLIR